MQEAEMITRHGQRLDNPANVDVDITSNEAERHEFGNGTEAAVPRVSFNQGVAHGMGKVAKSDSWVYMDGETSQTVRTKRMMSLCSICSDGTFCRICHEGDQKEELISPCKCSGTMGMIHQTCIEAWLSTSNTTRCEICNYEYNLRREDKTFREWLKSPSTPQDKKNIMADMLCFCLLTPLACVSCWLCVSGAAHYYSFKEKKHYWESIGLISLTIFLVSIYFIWMMVAIRYHCRVWTDWRSKNKKVTILNYTPSGDDESDDCTPVSSRKSSVSIALDDMSGAHAGTMGAICDEELGATGGVPLANAAPRQTSSPSGLNLNPIVEGSHSYVSYYVNMHHSAVCEVCHQSLQKHNVVAIQHHQDPTQGCGSDSNNNCENFPDQNVVSVPMPYVSVPLLPSVLISSSYPCLQKSSNTATENDTRKTSRPMSSPHGQQTLRKTTKSANVSPVQKPDQEWLPDPKHSSTPCKRQKKRARMGTDFDRVLLSDYVQDNPRTSNPSQARRQPSTIHRDTVYKLLSNQSDTSIEENQPNKMAKKVLSKYGSAERLLNVSDADQSNSDSFNSSSDGPKFLAQDNTLREIWVKPHLVTNLSDADLRVKLDDLKETSV
ncbi:E3 ubiquitin-protein ligase MARCHF4-like [Lineus longissimus]|uniref:E3 ubiquitin-protein ligase MARCHF4-like n=1 Tax=Lineus longissimus TaxID=88925 RepID=UPI00315CA9B4